MRSSEKNRAEEKQERTEMISSPVAKFVCRSLAAETRLTCCLAVVPALIQGSLSLVNVSQLQPLLQKETLLGEEGRVGLRRDNETR